MTTPMTLFVCGDVMTGRGIDQILAHPSSPAIQEQYVRDAREYVALAEQVNGPIHHPVDASYIWGDTLGELERMRPDARVINLETSVTCHDAPWPGKGIHYRMHPSNVTCLTAARIGICALANNHVLDYGRAGLEETVETLTGAGIAVAGAGRDLDEARRPAVVALTENRRVVVFSIGSDTSGIPFAWSANVDTPGVDMLPDLSDAAADDLLARVDAVKQNGDVVVISIHWGDNWGYEVPSSHVRFAHRLIDGGVDVIHGHSSHHPRPIEVYRGKLVLYGCGDFMNDYEGISGYEAFRDDLVLMYFPCIDPSTGRLLSMQMTPMRAHRMQLIHASPAESEWLRDRLALVSRPFDSTVERTRRGTLMLRGHATNDVPRP